MNTLLSPVCVCAQVSFLRQATPGLCVHQLASPPQLTVTGWGVKKPLSHSSLQDPPACFVDSSQIQRPFGGGFAGEDGQPKQGNY